MLRKRGFLAVGCILVVVAGALLAPAAGGSLPAFLVPLAPLFGFIVLAVVRRPDRVPAYSYLATPPRPSRAPPVQLSTN